MKKFRSIPLVLTCCLGLILGQSKFAMPDSVKNETLLQIKVVDRNDNKSNIEGKLDFDVTLINDSEHQMQLGVLDEKLPFTVKVFDSKGEIVNTEILRIRGSNDFPGLTDLILKKEEKRVFNVVYPNANSEVYKRLPAGTYSYSVVMPIVSLLRNGEKIDIPGKVLLLKSNLVTTNIGDVNRDRKEALTPKIQRVIVGDSAPDFKVTDINGGIQRLVDYKGKSNILVTFFPKCFTGGCATHLSSLRDHQKEFDAAKTQILAVSVDPADGEKGQLAFAKQWGFEFPLIPDTTHQMSEQFGAMQKDDELASRMTFLIDKQGFVRYIDTNVNVQTHGADMIAKIHELGLDAN